MLLAVAAHWELIGVATPQQLRPKIDRALSQSVHFEEVSNMPGQEQQLLYVRCVLQSRGVGGVYHSLHFVSGTVGTAAGKAAKGQPGDSL